MTYEFVSHTEHRKMIIDDDRSSSGREITPNLRENARMISSLRARECPLGADCVNLIPIDGKSASSICEFLGQFIPSLTYYEAVNCGHGGTFKERGIESLTTESCPAEKRNCLGCADLRVVVIPLDSRPKYSHAHIACI